jgi:hypothetical protein
MKIIHWMLLSTAAKAYCDFIFASGTITGHQIVHLWHPRLASWSDLADDIAQELQIPTVTFEDWFKALHALIDSNTNPKDKETLAHKFPLLESYPSSRLQ